MQVCVSRSGVYIVILGRQRKIQIFWGYTSRRENKLHQELLTLHVFFPSFTVLVNNSMPILSDCTTVSKSLYAPFLGRDLFNYQNLYSKMKTNLFFHE